MLRFTVKTIKSNVRSRPFWGVNSIDLTFDGDQVEHCEEGLSVFLEASWEPSHVFHFAKEALNNVAHGIEIGNVRRRITGIALCGNDAYRAFFCDLSPDYPAALGFIGDDRERWPFPVQKGMYHLIVVNIPARYCQTQGAAFFVYSSINFARATSA